MRKIPILPVLHLADLFRNPKMEIPSVKDWAKVREYLNGTWPLDNPRYHVETSYPQYSDWLQGAHRAPYVAIDTEYVAESRYLLLVGMGYPGGTILQFDHKSALVPERVEFGRHLRELTRRVPIVFQNAVADIPVLEKAYGIQYEDYKRIEDTMLAHAVLWSDWPHDLEFLASIYGRHRKFKQLNKSDPGLYNAGDIIETINAWEGIGKEFRSDPPSKNIYETQSLPTVPIILRAQSCGLRVNSTRVQSALRQLYDQRTWAQAIAQCFVGYPINIGSDDQLKWELYDHQHLPVQMVPRTTKRTVDADAIAALRAHVGPGFDADEESKDGLSVDRALQYIDEGANPLLEARVVYAGAQQQLSHYVMPMVGKERVYPQFHIHAQASGRWSTVEPPMAQIPKHLADLVIPDEGEKWVEWDWDQVELRILAFLSGDPGYQEAFSQGWDIHTFNTCDVFGWDYPSNKRDPHTDPGDHPWRVSINWGGKDDPRRRFAKVFIFRLNYGGEPRTATDIPGVKQLGLKASDLIRGSRLYLSRHPRIRQYWESISADGIAKREVRTFMGRRRRLLMDSKAAMKRVIYNHPMQGGVSDIFNTTLITVARECPQATFKYGVHDAQKWGVPEDQYDILRAKMYEIVHRPWRIEGREVIFPATFKP